MYKKIMPIGTFVKPMPVRDWRFPCCDFANMGYQGQRSHFNSINTVLCDWWH